MARQIRVILATMAMLVLLDLAVATILRTVAPPGLVAFFDYGRSVPGKLARWQADPGAPGNLFGVSWRPDMLAASAAGFAAEDAAPVVRVYGMSFVDQILQAAQRQRPALRLDLHSGPQAPPNFTYAMALDDRPNRRAGDIVVLGILAEALPGLATLGNRSWAFEQPAPFTYPVFRPRPGAPGLRRIDPLVLSVRDQAALDDDPARAAAWRAQLRGEDAFFDPAAYAAPVLDASPLARLVRRSVAVGGYLRRRDAFLDHPETAAIDWPEVLRRMVTSFAGMVRADGQVPVVLLVEGRGRRPVLAPLLRGTLEAAGIATLATDAVHDPGDAALFLPDGHYRPEVNDDFARALLSLSPFTTR